MKKLIIKINYFPLVLILIIFTISCSKDSKAKQYSSEDIHKTNYSFLNESSNSSDDIKETAKEFDPSVFERFIKLRNCTVTTDFIVPNINNSMILGFYDEDHPGMQIINNNIRPLFTGFQVALKNDIPIEQEIFFIAKSGNNEFQHKLNLIHIPKEFDHEDDYGYYENIYFESKFWVVNDSKWLFTIRTNSTILHEQEYKQGGYGSILFENISDSPFEINHVRHAELHKLYTYRFNKEKFDIIILYYSLNYESYIPILYLLPEQNDSYIYNDIGISWDDVSLRGIYLIGGYKLDNLPKDEITSLIFDSISVK
ncbi:MAG: hypothetical protein FWC01_01045 [Treponema sp.]|nr:hypothetical protein [Treponema sp.]MCL2236802.1 hypothetical protein [Treponema sp.]